MSTDRMPASRIRATRTPSPHNMPRIDSPYVGDRALSRSPAIPSDCPDGPADEHGTYFLGAKA